MLAYDDNTIGYSELIRTQEQKEKQFKLDEIEGTLFYALGLNEQDNDGQDTDNLQPIYATEDQYKQYVAVRYT